MLPFLLGCLFQGEASGTCSVMAKSVVGASARIILMLCSSCSMRSLDRVDGSIFSAPICRVRDEEPPGSYCSTKSRDGSARNSCLRTRLTFAEQRPCQWPRNALTMFLG